MSDPIPPAWLTAPDAELYAFSGRGPDYNLTPHKLIRTTKTLAITADSHGREARWSLTTLKMTTSNIYELTHAYDPRVIQAKARHQVRAAMTDLRNYINTIQLGTKYRDNSPEVALQIATDLHKLAEKARQQIARVYVVAATESALAEETDPS